MIIKVKYCKLCERKIKRDKNISNFNYNKRKYCSKKCHYSSRKLKTIKKIEKMRRYCKFCGKRMVMKKGDKQISNFKRKVFCNSDCQMKWRIGKSRSGNVCKDKKCKFCGKFMHKKDYHMSYKYWSRTIFCGRECWYEYKKDKVRSTLDNIKICEYCGKKISLYDVKCVSSKLWRIKRFCDINCLNKWTKGKTYEERYVHKTKKEIEQLKIRPTGPDSYSWFGGLSFEPYDYHFNKRLKEQIAERDNYICKICNKKVNKGHTHHIHYIKQDSRPETLVYLHNRCHKRTNFDRDYWFVFFCYLLGREPEGVLI
jgi:hypothetical protein